MTVRFAALALGLLAVGWVEAASPDTPRVVRVKVGADSELAGFEAAKAMDGDPNTLWHSAVGSDAPPHPHEFAVDLGQSVEITGFAYLPRADSPNGTIKTYELYASANGRDFGRAVAQGTFASAQGWSTVSLAAPLKTRYLKLCALASINHDPWTSIAEFKVLRAGTEFRAGPGQAVHLWDLAHPATNELQRQYAALRHDLRDRAHFARVAAQTVRPAALIQETDRDPAEVVLRRTTALLAHLQAMPNAPALSAARSELARLQTEAGQLAVTEAEARLGLYERACQLRRRIALANPLLNFNQVLFVKHHRALFDHMCDQYYGMAARPGGGLCVLSDPFGPSPTVRDVLAESEVRNGRLQGQKLPGGLNRAWRISFDGMGNQNGETTQGGSFLSPDLSFDGKTILFAYVECQGDGLHRHHTDAARGHWAEGRCYHVFKVNSDGSGLTQLTDGTWNDFDPCWLPNGRIAFISERRGGYLRCGRVCPTYTLYDMAADGSDLRCLSPHETNEWQPSVAPDGRIIYTRWDYVDRHGCTAHQPWTTTPDGRDARALHGNFSPRQSRPDMELDVRAIPGSSKYVATATPHHGQAYGSLILIDPAVKDDDLMAPVSRLTPEVSFPESQGGTETYGTAWPLSEDFFLCVYDAAKAVPGLGPAGNYGLYLVDSFGNKELLYRDPEIACLSPIPLRPRTQPPVVPTLSEPPGAAQSAEGTLAVVNVYDSLKPWPQGTKITALRVFHALPMSVPSGNPPHEVGMRIASGGDSVTIARSVLGTVPVESDGSAHFSAPAGKELFFQALDDQGLAVQSMRSATYLQPGERLVCQGCHEPKTGSPAPREAMPLALRRAPSRLQPEVEGTHPFSYPRLVQPVLDRNCVGCHRKNPGKAPSLEGTPAANGNRKWFTSYQNLAPKYGFWDYRDALRTTPGQFGARASRLYAMLEKGHHDLQLPPADLHRLTLWLDSCSIFYGVYEKEGGEAQLRGELARPTLQ